MSRNSEFEINEALYQWCVRAFSLLRYRLGISIKVHNADGNIETGQIFLFNHFARFETVIPQYFIYQATGAYCRCVAAHDLFQKNDRFTKLLWNCGAVPNNHPGMLPFLAAEILRGRKVIFFPEGSMIKDRRVMNGDQTTNGNGGAEARRHHQGAAALAFVLEIFKKRILSVYEAGETERLARWVKALGLADVDALVAAARLPTLIVPANITFYPIHTSDNILSKAAELFGRENISEQSKEELLIEGNLVLRRTDMDIRFGTPVNPHLSWNVVDRLILSQVFEQIDSLEELFAMKNTSGRWVERMVAMRMRQGVQRLRDLCMEDMYSRVTLNLSHVASRLILQLFDQGTRTISRERFHRLLYLAFKNVQAEPSIYLHRSLTHPPYNDGIHDGTNARFRQFIEGASAMGLLEVASDGYRFLPRLRQEHGSHDPRLENVISVYANEVAPVATACRAIDQALKEDARSIKPKLAFGLFDDEMRAYALDRKAFSGPEHAAINGPEEASESGEPYLIVPEQPKNLGIVLVHGFLASPAELKAFGKRLAGLGYPVIGVRLAGHGTSPWDLREKTSQDWLKSVRRGYEILSLLCENVCLVGFGAGAALCLELAAEKPKQLKGLVAVSAPIRQRPNRGRAFLPVIHGINKLTEWTYSHEGLMPFLANESEHPKIDYHHVPISGLVELRRLLDGLERRLPAVSCPVRILQATGDPVVDPQSAAVIHRAIGAPEKSLYMIKSERHSILSENIGDTQSLVFSFIAGISSSLPQRTNANGSGRDPALLETPVLQALPAGFGERMSRSFGSLLSPLRFLKPPKPGSQPSSYPWEKTYPPGIDWKAVIEPKPLPSLLDDAVKAYGERTAMSFRGKSYRYRELARLVEKAASGLQALGVGKGVRVGLMLPNCPYAVLCYYAVLKAGGTVVNINPLYAKYEIARQIEDSGCRFLFTLDMKGLYEKVEGLVHGNGPVEKILICRMRGMLRFREKVMFGFFRSGEVAVVAEDDRHMAFDRLLNTEASLKPVDIDPLTDIAVLQYTGGTTGTPKGAQLTHANLYCNTAQLALWAPAVERGREKSLAVLPLFHSFGMTAVMNLGLWIGAEIVLQPKFQARDVLKSIDHDKITIFIGVPTMFSALTGARDIERFDLSSLKVCISGGAPLPAEIQRRFEAISGCALFEGYGLSEASPVCTINPLSGGRTGSVGLPLPGTIVEIVSLEDPTRVLGPNQRGEICLTGPQIMTGYANRAKENIDIFRGGHMHTGDVGYLDEDGYLYIVDRIKDLILSGGFNVYPRQVEEIIHQHPAVEEVAVCGVPDPHRGEIVKAFIKLYDGATATPAELRDFCRDRLAPFQTPREFEFRSSLPKTLIGKISKKDLLAEAGAPGTERTVRAEAS